MISYFECIVDNSSGRGIYVIISKNGSSIKANCLSMGYRAYRTTSSSTQYGFVTAGHGFLKAIDNKVYSDTGFKTVIGNKRTYKLSGKLDVAFIETTSGNSISRYVKYSDGKGGTKGRDKMAAYTYMSKVAKNTKVYKVGATTYRTSGKVTQADYDVTVDGTSITNQTKTNMKMRDGDSGGIAYVFIDSENVPAGVMSAWASTLGINTSTYTKAVEAKNKLNIFPY